MDNDFSSWVNEELQKRGWTQADLSRKSGVTTAHISRILNRERMPGADFCVAIAKAFKISPVVVFVKAGILPEDVTEDDITDRLVRVLRGWSREERLRFLNLALAQDEMFSRAKPPPKAQASIADEKATYAPAKRTEKSKPNES